MNRLSLLLLSAVGVLLLTSLTLVVDPYLQLRALGHESRGAPYTTKQLEGREHYVSLGCVYCHSQQPTDPSVAPDGERGWGRPSTPADYAWDYPHQLGTMRTGPDLFNIGARQPSAAWHYVHLYQPRAVVPASIMPAYPFLFELKEHALPGDVVVEVPAPHGPTRGVVVATPAATALVTYLLGMDHTYRSDHIPREAAAEPSEVSP